MGSNSRVLLSHFYFALNFGFFAQDPVLEMLDPYLGNCTRSDKVVSPTIHRDGFKIIYGWQTQKKFLPVRTGKRSSYE